MWSVFFSSSTFKLCLIRCFKRNWVSQLTSPFDRFRQHQLYALNVRVCKRWSIKALHPPWLSVNAAVTYLSELSQPLRCWNPSCEVASETLSLKHSTGQGFSSHMHLTRVHANTHTYTQAYTHRHSYTLKHTQNEDITDRTSYFLCVNLSSSFFSPSIHVASCCFYFHVHTCSAKNAASMASRTVSL